MTSIWMRILAKSESVFDTLGNDYLVPILKQIYKVICILSEVPGGAQVPNNMSVNSISHIVYPCGLQQ